MGLEDFEKQLAQEQAERNNRKRSRSRSPTRKHRHRHHHHRFSRHGEVENDNRLKSHGHRKRRRRDNDGSESKEDPANSELRSAADEADTSEDEWVEKESAMQPPNEEVSGKEIEETSKEPAKRDSWMEAPSSLGIDYVQRKQKKSPPPQYIKAADTDYKLGSHWNELNQDFKLQSGGSKVEEAGGGKDIPAQHEVRYKFSDDGSHWRMSKLKGVYRQAKESGRPIEDIAVERYGDLRAFDDAREEEIELDRRRTYGKGYVGKEKPSGELFQDRKLDAGIHRDDSAEASLNEESQDEFEAAQGEVKKESAAPVTSVPLDQTALNKLKAQMMKAKLKGAPEAAQLEAEYNAAASAGPSKRNPEVVVLNKMESRMLAGGRKGEVKSVDNKRGRERRLVEENEDMTIEDMVRQERRSKGQFGGGSFAERIAKDAKFNNDLDYMDDNAAKLAKVGAKSDINLRNTAISEYQKTKRVLDTCPLCHHEDTSTPPQAPLVSLATRVYMTLPTSPEITPYGLCATIVPIQHHANLLECDDDEWEELRNFMKALTRFYHSLKPSRTVVFYENAAHQGRKRHASLEAVPLPHALGETAPAFFREAILAADEEWTQHKKIIDTMTKAGAEGGGLGKLAFRRTMVTELPYFHVWFQLDGGYGHVVEDSRRWPKGDLFAREIFGGMLDVPADVVKRQGRWKRGDPEMDGRVREFKSKGWDKWDWTSVLMDAQE